MPNYNILSIDGGGMKGLISAIVIEQLEKEIKQYSGNESAHICDYFDLIAGTSTGSILTGIYLCPDSFDRIKYTASDAVKLYQDHGKEIFTHKRCYGLKSLYGLHRSKYSNGNLSNLLNEYFGLVKLSHLRKPCLIPAYDIETGSAFFFNTISAKEDPDDDFYLKDAVLASAAAPTYFPPVVVDSLTHQKLCMVDGGISCNNPSMCAFVEAIKMPHFTSVDHVNIFSVGNISKEISYACKYTKKWGLIDWFNPLLHIFMDANKQTVDYQLKMLYDSMQNKDNYLRIEKIAENSHDIPDMDDASPKAMEYLTMIGHELITTYEDEIKAFAKRIVS